MSSRHYLDHNATSPLRPAARRAIEAALSLHGNPSSLHTEGRRARALIDEAREEIAALAGARAADVVLTSGGSEAISAALHGVCARADDSRRRLLIGATEHSAVIEAARAAAGPRRVVVEVPCNEQGRVDLERMRTLIGEDVALVALQAANNETGVVQPIAEIGARCREAGTPLLVDAVQAAGKLPLRFREEPYDLMALSAHKIGGPRGAGALVVRDGLELAPLIAGGAQEKRRRGGTEAVASIAGFGAAAREALRSIEREPGRLLRQRARLETRLREALPDLAIHGEGAPRLSNTVNLGVPGTSGEMLVIALDLAGFAVSTGSACASGAVRPSHVLRAMGLDDSAAAAAVRVSLGWSTEASDVDRFVAVFPEIVAQVREGLAEVGS